MNQTDRDHSSPAQPRIRRWARRLGWTLAALAGLNLLLFLALTALARGGPQAFVWQPPDLPPIEATEVGDFDISVVPPSAPVDVPVSIRVDRLTPGATALVIASTTDARDVRFESWARFVADASGRLALDTAIPEDGTYRGAEGNGLLWSMRAADRSLFYTSAEWHTRSYQLTVISDGKRCEVAFERRYPYSEVTRESVGGTGWSGQLTLQKEAGPGPRPAVIFLAGWDDPPAPLTSALIAQRGYAVLNVGYHGWEGLPEEMVEIPLEAVTRAIDWLERRPEIDARRVGVYGISRGAELGLAAAARDPRIVATAAWVPASEVFAGISLRSLKQRSSWTWQGEPLPFAKSPFELATLRVTARLLLRRPTSFRTTYAAGLAASDGTSAIPVERIAGEILLAAGRDDQVWPSAEMSERIAARVSANGAKVPVTKLIFPHAGHGLSYALWPSGDFTERFLIRGGTPEANHLAGREAWVEMMALFERQLQ